MTIFIADNTVLSAIYIEPPVDVRKIPQSYTIHCITTGQKGSNIMAVGVFLERHGQSYYNNNVPPVLGYCQTPRTTRTYDYSEEVVWKADRTEFDQTEFSKLGLTKYNADHDWACGINYSISGYDDLQTYIRGKAKLFYYHSMLFSFVLAPNFVPTNLTILSQNSTSITIAWSAVNITEADGYVVYINHLYSDKHSAVITNNTRQYTLWYRQELPLYGYNITVRAHQDLLGPPSEPIVIPTTNCKSILLISFHDLKLFSYNSVTDISGMYQR